LLGAVLPERVAGIDLMSELLDLAERERYRVYVLGARADVLERAIANIRDRHPHLKLAGRRDGYFADEEAEAVAAEVRAAAPDIVFLAMSSPRKEYWIAEHGGSTGAALVVGVGGAIDVWAGVARRAPLWMQRAGLEWFYRLAQEPRRMWRRYLVTNLLFGYALCAALVKRLSPRGRMGRFRVEDAG
jgi:N-acetylglucosaminyldiphosphoundecaprenol N-acetyl-beta-D-mannosaminyltransferase